MTNLEIRAKEEMTRVLNEETKYAELLEALVFNGDIYELTIESAVFGHNDIKEFCQTYARINMAGDWEDVVLNLGFDEELAEMTKTEAMEAICKKELDYQIELSKENE